MRWVHKAPSETFNLLLKFLRAYQDSTLPDFAEPPIKDVVTKPVSSPSHDVDLLFRFCTFHVEVYTTCMHRSHL
jgi:hypothetical protein